MPINLKLSSSANGTRNVTPSIVDMGGGPNMLERSLFSSNAPNLSATQWHTPGTGSPAISTSDYYHLQGMILSRPYDLDTMGSEGATIKAREGKRYIWMLWSDHLPNFPGTSDLYAAYSDDPQVFPDPTTMRALIGSQNSISSYVDKYGRTQNNFLCYWYPSLVYNPDPGALAPFYIYAESLSTGSGFQHQLGLVTTSDFLSVTFQGATNPTTVFGGWAAPGRVVRLGVNSWEAYSIGKIDGTAVTPDYYRYTSTDGWDWTPDYSNVIAGQGPYHTFGGQRYCLVNEKDDPNSYMSWQPVNSNSVATGGYTRISDGFGSTRAVLTADTFPGPTYLQHVESYEEDGVISLTAVRGFPLSGHDATIDGPYLGNTPSLYNIVGGISGGILDVTTWPPGSPPLAVGMKLGPYLTAPYITGFGTGAGGVGTYTVTGGSFAPGSTFTVVTNGGTWHQWIDQYRYISDATAAASAAPLGVKASCTNNTVTISWNNSLPHQNYRVYRGTSAASQPTLVGNVTGTSIADTPTPGAQYFYKVVTMNVTEQKSRVVNIYCSNNTLMVNKHVTRFINAGGNLSNIDISFVATADAWLTSNDAYKYLKWWTDVRFGYLLDGSGFISKIFCLGTTRLPKGGDYTPTTSNTYPSTSSNTSYSSNSFRGTTPSWINNASTAKGYFGGGRANNIILSSEITLLAAYQKPSTGAAAFFGLGEFTGLYLQHSSGSPGAINFAMVCDKLGAPTTFTTATATPSSATAAAVVAGVFDGTNLIAYYNGTPGSSQSGGLAASNSLLRNNTILRGQYGSLTSIPSTGSGPVLASGSRDTRFSYTARNYVFGNNEAQFTGAGLAVFDKGLSQSLVQSWGAVYA